MQVSPEQVGKQISSDSVSKMAEGSLLKYPKGPGTGIFSLKVNEYSKC